MSDAKTELLNTCLCCDSGDLVGYLDLGRHPLAHAYHQGDDLPRLPLELVVCVRCFHSQLSLAVDPELRARNDLFVSGTTTAVRNHQRALAQDTVAWTKAKSVLDVGCSDGALLEDFLQLGCTVVGVDRSPSLRRLTRSKGIRVLDQRWGESALQELVASGDTPFDLITATNVLAQVSDPLGFLRTCADALAPRGTILVEVPYTGSLPPRHELDLPHHEQVSYFLVRSFATLAKRAGLEVSHLLRTDHLGGSMRFLLREPERLPRHGPSVQVLLDDERDRGLHETSSYSAVQEHVARGGRALERLLADARRAGRKTIGYGACASGSAAIDRFDLGLERVVDDDPIKWGFSPPGRAVPIVEPRTLADDADPLTIVVFAWHALEEVRRKVLAFRGSRRGDTFVLCAPSLREVPTWASPRHVLGAEEVAS